MVTSPDGCGVIIIGGNQIILDDVDAGRDYNDLPSDKILELRSDATEWIILDQRLKNPRMEHVAFPITDEVENNLKEKYFLEDK